MFWNQYKLRFDMVHNDTYFRLELKNEAGNNGGKTSKVVCKELSHLKPFFIFLCLLNSHTLLQGHTLPLLFFPPQDTADCVREPSHPALLEVGGGGQSWRWCRCSVFFVAVEEEEGQDSESCGGRFSALSGQQLQHLLPLRGNHTGCYCSRQRWKKGGWVGGCGLGVEDDIGGGEGKGRGSKA